MTLQSNSWTKKSLNCMALKNLNCDEHGEAVTEKSKIPDFDSVLEELGLFGKYQIMLILAFFSGGCVTSMHILGGTLMAASVPYMCSQVLVQAENCNFSRELPLTLMNKMFNANTSIVQTNDNHCSISEVKISLEKFDCENITKTIKEMQLKYQQDVMSNLTKDAVGPYYIPFVTNFDVSTNISEKKCLVWDFDTSIFKATVVTDLNLVCDDKWKKEMSQIVLMCGVLVGAFLMGFLSDRFGRKPSVCIACTVLSISTISTTFVWDYNLYCILQFFTGLGGMGLFVVGFVSAMEHVNAKWRVPCGQFLQCAFSIGFICLAFLGYFIRDWRKLNITLAVFMPVFLFVMWRFSMESPRWLIANHKTEKAQNVLKKIAKINGKSFDVSSMRYFYEKKSNGKDQKPLISEEEKNEYKPLTVIDLLKNCTLLKITLMLCYNWFSVTCVYYGLTFIVSEIDGDPYLNLFLSGLVELPANFCAIFVINKWGRRPTVSTCNLISGISLVAMQFFPISKSANLILYLIGKFGATATFSCIYTYTAELYPTALRGQGVGFCSSCARIGGLTSVAIIMLRYYAPFLPFVIYGIISLSAGLIVLLLPETKGCMLPDVIQDCERQYKNRNITLKEQYFPYCA